MELDVCHGLAHAHERGVVHRDIKPSNVMVLSDGSVKIVDFGIAQIANDNLTKTGTIVGSLNYMSPEQVRAQKIDGRSDIFSTGTVLYELLTGVPPFETGETAATLFKIVGDDPPPFERFLLEFPPDLETITLKALAKRPEDRYASAAELARDLSGLTSSLMPYAIRPAPVSSPARASSQILPGFPNRRRVHPPP